MLCGKPPAVLFRSDNLERFVVPKHGKDDVADLMHDSAHCYWLFLSGTHPGVVVVNYRIHRCAAPFINLYVIERGHVKNPSGKGGATLGHMYFIAIEFPGLFDSGVKPKVGVKLFRGRKSLKSPISAIRTTALKKPIPRRDCRRQICS